MLGLTARSGSDHLAAPTQALVLRAQEGDAAAFRDLLANHYDLIFRTAWKWCGSRSDAEDVAQEVCIRLGQGIKSFDNRASFSSWLYRVTLNAVRDFQRAGRRRGHYANALTLVTLEEQPADQEAAATSNQLWAAVRKLPEQQRDAVLLVYGEELSHSAAADIMGIKEATVSFHVHAARKTLRALL
jgi:RNA polymerase sigma-70 factor (ECF subfamily)